MSNVEPDPVIAFDELEEQLENTPEPDAGEDEDTEDDGA